MAEKTGPERRKQPRVEAQHAIVLEWQTGEGELHRARGTTRDMALGGVYCMMERPLDPGVPVDFNLVLPAQLTGGKPLKLRCAGKVLRSERAGERAFGVAVSIDTSEVAEVLPAAVDAGRHRIYARIVPSISLQAEYPGMRSVVRDVSLAGAFIEDDRPLPVGRVFKLRLSSERVPTEIEVVSVVRRVEPHVGMAVEFVALSKEAKKSLEAIVAQGRPWEGPGGQFPSKAWEAAEGEQEPPTVAQAVEFVRQRAGQILPQLEVVGCHYRVGDCLFSLHLRDPASQAELLLPISDRWVQECLAGGDCSQIERALGAAAKLLDLNLPRVAPKP